MVLTITESSNRLIASLDDPLTYLWFPENGVRSQVVESGNGGSVEVAFAGLEGVVGLPAIFGAEHSAACECYGMLTEM